MEKLSHSERVLRTLNHQEPDRVPVDLGSTSVSTIAPGTYRSLKTLLSLAREREISLVDPRMDLVIVDEEILARFDIDTQAIRIPGADMLLGALTAPHGNDTEYVDEWGVVNQRLPDGQSVQVGAPFAGELSISAIKSYAWPDSERSDVPARLGEIARSLRGSTDRALVATLPARVLSLGQMLCGFEKFMEYLVLEPRLVEALLEKAVEIQIRQCDRILEALGDNVDVVMVADDLGMQSGPQISPAVYRRLIKPYQRILYQAIKKKTTAKLMLHSDGGIYPLIADLIELGVDALNPVQVSAAGMEPRRLKAAFGPDLAFWGGIDTQHILPHGTTADVRVHVREQIEALATGGGYVLAAVQDIDEDVPAPNVVAMFDAAFDFGVYS